MTVPVIKLLLQQHPQLHITYVSASFVKPLFAGIERLSFHAIETKGKHKGIRGLYRLSKELRKGNEIDAVADLHNVLRTKLLRRLFFSPVKNVAVIDKGREEKRELTRIKNKKLRPLRSTFERYAEVFGKLGYAVKLWAVEPIEPTAAPHKPEGNNWIGVAPFAKHLQKMYPLDRMKDVVKELTKDSNNQIFLFGSKDEAKELAHWQTEMENVVCLAGRISFAEELIYISQLDAMVSMDSANMHLASLYNIPVVSIWGSTHPYAGFYGWQQDPENAVQVELYCRPCSVFGNRPCYRGDLACLMSITPQMVVDRVAQVLYRGNVKC